MPDKTPSEYPVHYTPNPNKLETALADALDYVEKSPILSRPANFAVNLLGAFAVGEARGTDFKELQPKAGDH